MTWTDDTTTSTVSNKNASRFICAGERADATGGVDFGIAICQASPFVITSLDPRAISSTTLNDPV